MVSELRDLPVDKYTKDSSTKENQTGMESITGQTEAIIKAILRTASNKDTVFGNFLQELAINTKDNTI